MKKAFSLFEIIIVISVIAIISSMGVYKLFFTLEKASILDVKTQIHLIQNGIIKHHNKSILKAQSSTLNSLDNTQAYQSNEKLFTHILNHPIISTNTIEKRVGHWIKLSQNQYEIILTKSKSVIFKFDKIKSLFTCNESNVLCKELLQ